MFSIRQQDYLVKVMFVCFTGITREIRLTALRTSSPSRILSIDSYL